MNVGYKLDGMPPEEVVPLARAVEDSGLDEVWVVEDFGLGGGIAQSALALSATKSILVGHGIAPASVRNVMYYAMEIATLCRTYPGRFMPGIGHGMPNWLEQVGAHPASLMSALTEVAEVAGRLLAGETVSFEGQYVHVRDVALAFPPQQAPLISLGVRGPRGLAASGAVAGGAILAEGSGPTYVREARRLIGVPTHRVTVFSWFSVDDDRALARRRVESKVQEALGQAFMRAQVKEFSEQGLTDDVVSELTISGSPEDCATALRRLRDAGADSIILQPAQGLELSQLDKLTSQVLPILHVE